MNIAILGCGFVADHYVNTLKLRPHIRIVGVYDRDTERLTRFCEHHGLRAYESLDELLGDEDTRIVVNLTNPRSHYETSRAALEAGKHVYSEKPLAMRLEDAEDLVRLAEDRGLYISGAPCNVLSETAQTVWKALRENRIGTPRLVYAELDDGFLPQMPYQHWISEAGAPWPAKDEFEVGCTLEHAGYYLTWLAAFFGPAESITAFAATTLPDKHTEFTLDADAPDFSVACLRFASGLVARLACSIVAPHDHGLRIIGDEGILSTDDCWFYRNPVYVGRRVRIRRRLLESPIRRKLPLVQSGLPKLKRAGAGAMDYGRGVAELAAAVDEQREPVLTARFSLHITELALAIHNATADGTTYEPRSRFEPVSPMPWACGGERPTTMP